VLDAVRAITELMRHPKSPGRVFNVGGTDEISITSLAERIKQLTGSASPIVRVPYSEAYAPGFEDMQRRVPDVAKLRCTTGFAPSIGLEEALHRIIAAMRAS
jgi:UDP-glucose 4-epimerase